MGYPMSQHRQSVREYIRARELILKVEDLTDVEQEQIRNMLKQISAGVLDGHSLSKPDTSD